MKEIAWKCLREAEEKSLKILGAQNEVADMAIRANAELEQVNARLSSLSHHYEQLSKRADELVDEGRIQLDAIDDLRELCLAEEYGAALRYSNAMESNARLELVGILSKLARDEDTCDSTRVNRIKSALDRYENEFEIPF